jgi:pyruvate/2-oxoglutarate dehydrogenase complex dihydrolipoamide dehydrogenase (E3) component
VVTEVRGDADAALKGIWTNREVTGMKTVARRLLVLGEGPVGVQLAQAVHRLGGEVMLVKGARNLLVNEARPLSEALAQVLREEGIELFVGATAAAARREGDVYILELDDGNKASGDRLLGRHGPSAPAVATGRRPPHREPRPIEGWRGG